MQPKVLLAEDDADIREVFRLGLEHDGLHIIEAADGLEMLSILQLQRVDAVVIDIAMPRIDGISAINTIRTLPHLETAVIIVVTALDDPKVEKQALEAGAVKVLRKPISVPDLVAALREYLPSRN
jgi:CheY-like chemotaxis protein